MIRFIILSNPRSGTNFLQGLLDEHPQISCLGEVFHRNFDFHGLLPPGTLSTAVDLQPWYRARDEDPQGLLEQHVWSGKPPGTLAAGFRIFPPQFQICDQFPLRYLPGLPDLKVIQLWRENELARYLSLKQAEATGLWTESRPTRAPPLPLEVDPRRFLHQSRWVESQFRKIAQLFPDERVFRISYETLAKGWQVEIPRLFDFLGLPHRPVAPRLHVQARYRARAVVLNYDKVAQALRPTEHARWLQDASASKHTVPVTDPGPPPLLCHLGGDDADLVPAFLAHYRTLGVSRFHVVLHGPPGNRAVLRALLGEADITIENEYEGPFSEQVKCDQLNRLLPAYRGRWVLLADADEFLELPYASLAATIRALKVLRLKSLTAVLVQRLAADGSLPPLHAGRTPQATYPLGSVLLSERMNPAVQPMRNKVPLFLVQDDTHIIMGHHVSPTPDVSHSVPLRGVVHHFKWRYATRLAVPRRRKAVHANGWEVDGYGRYLEANRWRLPLAGSFRPDHQALVARGLLQRPDRPALALHATLGQLRQIRQRGDDPSALPKLVRRVATLQPLLRVRWAPAGDFAPAPTVDALLGPQRQVCLLTFQLAHNDTSGGIGTAVAASAEALALAGHSVTVVYTPLGGNALQYGAERIWHAQQVRVVTFQAQSMSPQGGFSTPRLPTDAVTWIAAQGFDLVHLHDCLGLGAGMVAARRAGLMFWRTPLIVTAHGMTPWHRDGNDLPLRAQHLHIDHAERLQLALADSVVTPSAWMLRWLRDQGYRLPQRQVVHPNLLTAAARLLPRPSDAAPDGMRHAIHDLAFFGRLEPRKGLDSFCAAVDALAASGAAVRRVIFMGRMDRESEAEKLLAARFRWPFPSEIIEGYDSQTALHYMREAEALVVIPSRHDNLPYTVYECLAAGVPMIAVPVGGVPELVHEEDRERVLVAAEPAALATAMQNALALGFAPGRLACVPDAALLQWLAWQDALLVDPPVIAPASLDRPWWSDGDARALDVVLLDNGLSGPALAMTLHSINEQVGQPANIFLRAGVLAGTDFDTPDWPRKGDQQSIRRVNQIALDGTLPWGAQANRLAAAGQREVLVFTGREVDLDQRALRAFGDALSVSGADAAVSAHDVFGNLRASPDSRPRLLGTAQPLGGPTALAVIEDLYGVRCFAIRRAAFEALGGFCEDTALGPHAAGELLTRLVIGGGTLLPLPIRLYRRHLQADGAPDLAPTATQRRRLAQLLAPALATQPRLGEQWLRLLADSEEFRPDIVEQVVQAMQGLLPDQDVGELLQGSERIAEFADQRSFRRLRAVGHAQFEALGRSLCIQSSGIDPIVLLRGVRMPTMPCQLIVTCDMEFEQSAMLQLFWQTKQQHSYSEERSQRQTAARGRHMVRFVTPVIQPHGWLRLDPLAGTGMAILHHLEVHATRA